MLHPLNLRHTSPSPPPGRGRQKTRVPVVGSREACAQGPDRQRRRGLPRRREPEQDQPRSGTPRFLPCLPFTVFYPARLSK